MAGQMFHELGSITPTYRYTGILSDYDHIVPTTPITAFEDVDIPNYEVESELVELTEADEITETFPSERENEK
jgi:hypothetical protein